MKGQGCSKGIWQIYPYDILTRKRGKTRIKGGHPLEIKRDQQGFPASLPGARCRRNRSLKRETKHKARVSSLVSQGLLFLAHLIVSGPGCFPRLALALAFFLDLSHVEAIAGDRGRVERKRRSKSGKNDQRYVTAPHGPQSINSGIDQFNHSRLHPTPATLRPNRR